MLDRYGPPELEIPPISRRLRWDSSRVPWDEVSLDVAGLGGDLTPLAQIPVTVSEGVIAAKHTLNGLELYLDA